MGFSGGMNLDVAALKNRYYGFRHGESLANVEGIIVSDPEVGTKKYGLSEKGKKQVSESARRLSLQRNGTVIVSSDFRRAAETAEIVRRLLGVGSVRFDARLRERFFGDWDGACYLHYADTWQKDEIDPDQEMDGAESANAVRQRMVQVVLDLDRELSEHDIILVSHGDPLRMLQTAFESLDTALNRTIPYFETAQWRLLNP